MMLVVVLAFMKVYWVVFFAATTLNALRDNSLRSLAFLCVFSEEILTVFYSRLFFSGIFYSEYLQKIERAPPSGARGKYVSLSSVTVKRQACFLPIIKYLVFLSRAGRGSGPLLQHKPLHMRASWGPLPIALGVQHRCWYTGNCYGCEEETLPLTQEPPVFCQNPENCEAPMLVCEEGKLSDCLW